MDKTIAVQAALTRQLFSANNRVQVVSIILAVFLAYMQSEVIDSGVVLAWGFMVVLVALSRTALAIAYQRSDTSDHSATQPWLTRFRLGVFASGVAWGSASIWLFPANDPQHQIFLAFILAGLTAGGLVSYAADLVSASAYVVLLILPLTLRMFITEESLSVAMSMGLILYLGFLLMSLRSLNRNVSENATLHLEAAEREKIARVSEQRYRLLLEHSPVGIIHYNSNLIITYSNDCFADMLHTSVERLNGLDMNTLKDQSILPALRKALGGEFGYYEGHYSATHSDADKWVAITCAPSLDGEGRIAGGVAIIQDITERKLAEAHIHNLAFYDSLTKIPNRRMLNDRLDQTIAASRRNARYGALMFLDLDNFKPLNDTHGHTAGDLLLIEAARRIGSCIRETDTVARFGGDEFVVLLGELKEDQAESTTGAGRVAEKIRASMSEPYRLMVRQDDNSEITVEHHCTSSIGVVLFNHQASREEILKQADKAMYEAKKAGRNCVVFNKQSRGKTGMDSNNATILHLEWHNSYACGEPIIDDEHRKLFELANNLIDSAFTRNENPREFDADLERLLAHVVQHFADEEAILARHHYNDLEAHAHDHKVLIEHAQKLRDSALAGGVTIGELVSFLAEEVVAQHMLKTDHKYFPLFKRGKFSMAAPGPSEDRASGSAGDLPQETPNKSIRPEPVEGLVR
ncbi:MAG: diguanylate cyclase [Gammaproteobacteria bacterium]|nr:diguanylate cyclase [Gammaproteobacteria bacterium]MBU1481142.1 diguanylate cyclase [Gammaproteobacteria bacterium]